MKKILFICCIICILFNGCDKKEINTLKAENQQLKNRIIQLEDEIKSLKETDQYYYQQAIALLNEQKYQEAQDKFSELIAKFPASILLSEAKERLQEIKQNRQEATNAINSLPAKLAKAPNALSADEILKELEQKYNYPDVKEAISQHREKLQAKIKKETEIQNALKELGIEISNIRTYWTLNKNVLGGEPLAVPYIRFRLKNIGTKAITQLSVSASFELTKDKEILGEGSSYVISSFSDHPLKPGYSKEVFFGSSTGYIFNAYSPYRKYPRTNAELFVEVNGGEKRMIKEITIRREFQY